MLREFERLSQRMQFEWLLQQVLALPNAADEPDLWRETNHAFNLLRKSAVATRQIDALILVHQEAIEYGQAIKHDQVTRLQVQLARICIYDARTTMMAEQIIEDILEAYR